MIKTLYRKLVKKKVADIIKDAMYKDLNDNYVSDFPQLKNTVLSKNSQEWIKHNIEIIDYSEEEKLAYLKKGNLVFVTTPDYPYIIREIFCNNLYFLSPKILKAREYFVIDIGMNRGYASLYFASQQWCKGVYGFELSNETFKIAQLNFDLNKGLSDKIWPYNFGLGNKDEIVTMYYLPHRDGICTTSKEFLLAYAPKEMKNVIETESTIRKSSTTLKTIMESNPESRFIVKIDVEGAEYAIIDNLLTEYPAFFDRADIIIGDAHLGLQPLVDSLQPLGYKEIPRKQLYSQTHDFLFVKNV